MEDIYFRRYMYSRPTIPNVTNTFSLVQLFLYGLKFSSLQLYSFRNKWLGGAEVASSQEEYL